MVAKFIVKKANVVFEFPKTELIVIDETPDGVAFSLKSGIIFNVSDPSMDQTMKRMIKTAEGFNGVITIDLLNRQKPVSVNLG